MAQLVRIITSAVMLTIVVAKKNKKCFNQPFKTTQVTSLSSLLCYGFSQKLYRTVRN